MLGGKPAIPASAKPDTKTPDAVPQASAPPIESDASKGCKVFLSTFAAQIPSTVKGAAAIDFGASACGVGYRSLTTDLKAEAGTVPLNTDNAQAKIPSRILLNEKLVCIEFGARAEQLYRDECSADSSKRAKLFFFRYIKMHLYQYGSKTKGSNAGFGAFPDLKAENGVLLPAMTVFTAALRYLKDATVAHINKVWRNSTFAAIDTQPAPASADAKSKSPAAVSIEETDKLLTATTTYVADDLVWMVTVPMIWTYRARKFMLDAAVEAGMKHVSVGLEPECAALACRADAERTKLTQSAVATTPTAAARRPSTSSVGSVASVSSLSVGLDTYMVVDCGGGTIDIAVCSVVDDEKNEIDDITPPEGNDLGSRAINREFERFMGKLIGDKALDKFQALKPAVWSNMTEGATAWSFENLKMGYTPLTKPATYGDYGVIAVLLPGALTMFLHREKVALQKCVDAWNKANPPPPSVDKSRPNRPLSLFTNETDEEQYLRLPCWLFRRFVMAVVTPIVKMVTDMLATVPKCRVLYVVGGFSQCELLTHALESLSSSKFAVRQVAHPHLCVLKGAVIAALNPTSIRQRVLTATYGVATSVRWKPEHARRPVYTVEETKEKWAQGAFLTIAKKWDFFKANQVVHVKVYPLWLTQKTLSADIYYHRLNQPDADAVKWTDDPGVSFTTGSRELDLVALPQPLKSTSDRPVCVNLKLGATVITYSITDVITGNTTEETTFNHFSE